MANELTFVLASTGADNSGGNALHLDLSQIRPVIMKRSEICCKGALPSINLRSCLRGCHSSWSRPMNLAQNGKNAFSVHFGTSVSVRRIPSRFDYAESVRADLWSSLRDIRENALRNEAEFSFDGAQWRHCSEEDDFFLDKRSGSLIHPAHVETVSVFDGIEWKPISNDIGMVVATSCPRAEGPREFEQNIAQRWIQQKSRINSVTAKTRNLIFSNN